MSRIETSTELHSRVSSANLKAIERINRADLYWIGWESVAEAVPGMKKNIILKSGPPAPWERLTPVQRHGVINTDFHIPKTPLIV